MSVLNLNSLVYEDIKKSASEHCRTIGHHAAYLIEIGLLFCENHNASFKQLEKMAIDRIKDLKVSG